MAGAFSSGNNDALWVRNPTEEAGEVLVRFEDTSSFALTAARFGMTGNTAWQHLVPISSGAVMLGTSLFYNINAKTPISPPSSLRQPSSLVER